MNIKFTTAESAFCPRLKTREGHEEHISRLHLPISSLPSPAEPLEISSFPIAIHSETPSFNPKSVANLWLQLLVIQVQNANFWNYEDVVKVQNDKTYVKSLAAWKAENPTPRLALEIINDPQPEKLDEKCVLFLRHKLQKGFLSRDQRLPSTEMPDMSRFIKKLEDAPDFEAEIMLRTKIHKVLIAICKLDLIPGDEEFKFRERSEMLIAKWRKTLDDNRAAQESTNLALIPDPTPKPVEPQPAVKEEVSENIEEVDPMPAVCITQLTPDQCVKVEALALACDPPLDRAVVELMCMLPQFSAHNAHETYQIVPFGQLLNPVRDLEDKTNPERKSGGWGPKVPPHVCQLTEWMEGNYGKALFVDTKTGEGIVFKDYRLIDHEERDPKWEHLVGDKKPIEELLQEWIDEFLEGKFMPSGGETVHEEGPRYIVDILMDNLKHNALLREYGWPQSFPLSAPLYREFLKRKNELHKTTFYNNPRHRSSLEYKWGSLVSKWRFTENPFVQYDTSDKHQYELLSALDRSIREALKYHERRIEDREYALAADVPMQKNLMHALALGTSSSSGEDWRVEVTPDMIMKRFEEVFAASPEAVDEDTGKMREVLERAYERWKLNQQGIYERDWWSEEDDDSTSDYEPEDEEVEYQDEEEYEDEDMEDLDVGVLQADMADDVEMIRVGLAGYQVGSA